MVVRGRRVVTGTVGRDVEVDDDEMGFVASDELDPRRVEDLADAGVVDLAPPRISRLSDLLACHGGRRAHCPRYGLLLYCPLAIALLLE